MYIQQLQKRCKQCHSQSEARAATLVFWSAGKYKASVTILADFCPEFNPPFFWRCKHQTKKSPCISITCTLLNRLYGVWHLWLFTWYFRFQNKCNRNKFVAVSRWISGFYIKQIHKECHWTPFCPPITLRGREYYFLSCTDVSVCIFSQTVGRNIRTQSNTPHRHKNDYCQTMFFKCITTYLYQTIWEWIFSMGK